MSRVEKAKGGDDGGQRKRTAPSPYMRGNAPIIKDTYQIGDTLGKGAFGTVFRGLNIKTGEVVAIKQIEKKLIREDQMPQIMQELELLQNLYHANLVQFIDYKDSPEYLYFILEYVEGGNLHDTMKKFGKFPESLLVIYITQVLRGLEYLHKQGVIHRDIKGANILLTKEGTCKLADFGSCSYAAVLQKEELVGTPFWMAPEIISKEDATTSADIWSLGCTILELLTGMAPYWRLGPDVALYRMVNDDHPPLPAQISEPLTEFLMGCFIKDEKKRPSASDLMKFQWIRSLWARDDDPPPPDDTKGDKKGSPKTVKTGKSRSVILPRIWTSYQNNRSSGSHLMSTSPTVAAEKSDTTAQELETVWQKIRGDKSKKDNNLSGSKDGKDNNSNSSGNNNSSSKDISNKDGNGGKDNNNNSNNNGGGGGGGKERSRTGTSGSFATLSGNSKLSKEMKQLEEMDLSPQQFLEFLNWWKEWEQGQTKARSAAEAGIDGGKTLGKKKSMLGLKKKGLGTGRSVELILPPDYEYIQRIRKEVAAAAAAAAEDKKRKGVAAAAASAAKKKKKATKSNSEPSDPSQTTTSTSTSSSSSSSSSANAGASSSSGSSRSPDEAESAGGLSVGRKGSRIGRGSTDLLSASNSGRSLGGDKSAKSGGGGGGKSASGERSKEAVAEAETEETEKKPTKKRSTSRRENKKENSTRDNKKEIVTVSVTTASNNEAKAIEEAEEDDDAERNAMEESMDCLDEQQRIMQHIEEEDTVTLCRRLLQLNKDNEELREKRTTLEALLVLEREDMADLQKAHADLQASLVEVATEKQQLREDIAQLKELAAQSQLEKANLSAELKTLVSALQDSEAQAKDSAVGWMVPGAKCQAQSKDGLWLDAVILAHHLVEDVEGNKVVSFGVVFIDSGGAEESVRASAIRAPREEGWGSAGSGGRGNGAETTRKKSKTLFSWKKNDVN